MLEELAQNLAALEKNENLRKLQLIDDSFINLSSNDYLGIASDAKLYDEFMNEFSKDKLAFSASSSRLLSGNSIQYAALEQSLANHYRKSCLVFNSGYHANSGIIPAISSKHDLIIADKLVHASIIDGMKLSQAEMRRFRHLDYAHLEQILKDSAGKYKNTFIISESIFSMDGDIADLKKLVALKNTYVAILYIDEAHAVGVRGANGLGCLEEENLIETCDFIVGTFGKALASVGAYVICSESMKQYLINMCRTLIYTTALPPINLAWTKFIIHRLGDFQEKRESLKKISVQFGSLLSSQSESHIIPYICGPNEKAILLSEKLKEAGFIALPIRYPTVAEGTARVRFSLNSNLKFNHLLKVQKVLNEFE